ncbi:MAG: GspH/FimT family pseudopilin [Betaproteobacteria bacterium]
MKPYSPNRRLSGFTIIESMITIVVLSVMVTVAIPWFTDLVLKNRVNSTATDIQMSLLLARSEAVKRNTTASITPTDNTAWTKGWMVTYVDGGGTTRTLKTQAAYPGGAMTVTGPPAVVAYGREGRLTGTTSVTLTVNVPGNSRVKARTVAVDVGGRPNVH